MPNNHNSQLAILTLATILISTSGALGKYIEMPTPVVIWWRCALASIFLFLYLRLTRISLKIDFRKDALLFALSAFFLGAHWITYFYSLKASSVAIGMLSLFTFPIITTILEPFFSKSRLDPYHILLGCMVLIGIYFLTPDFSIENDHVIGILLGIFSALCYALRNLILKKRISVYNGTMLMFYQVVIVTILLLPALFVLDSSAIYEEYPFVIILALVTTAIGHTLFIRSLKYFKVSTASIIGSTQPVFGIIIAFIFLDEIPHTNTLIGGSIILATVVIESLRSRKSVA